MLVYGGWDWENSFSDVYLFHVASSSWRQLPFDAPTAERVRHTTVVNPRTGVAHAFGGEDRNRYLQNAMFAIGVNDESGRGSFELVNCGAVPSERFGHAAAYHAPSATMLVCAGYAGDMAMASDLFQFNFGMVFRLLDVSTPHLTWASLTSR